MLGFLKRFFGKETEKVNIKFDELGRWLDDKTKTYSAEFLEHIKTEKNNLDAIKKDIITAVDSLKEGKIEDEDKILPKVKSIVIAARNDYTRNIEHLMNELEVDDSSEDSAIQSCNLMRERLDAFAKRTTKEYFKTQHLFHKPLEEIAKHLKDLGRTISGLESYAHNSKLSKTIEIKKLLEKLNDDISALEELNKLSKELEKQAETKGKELDEARKDISELERSDIYIDYQKDIERLNKLRDGLKRKGDEIYELLAPIQAGLKRYMRVALENLEVLSMYIDDPVKALADDDEFAILIVLDKLKDVLEKGDLDIKDEKRKKMIALSGSITRDKLENLRNSYLEFEKGVEEAKEATENNNIQVQKEGLLKKREKLAEEISSLERDIKHAKEKISKFDTEKEKKKLMEHINKLFDIEVILE